MHKAHQKNANRMAAAELLKLLNIPPQEKWDNLMQRQRLNFVRAGSSSWNLLRKIGTINQMCQMQYLIIRKKTLVDISLTYNNIM